jgi:hypothetical protein
MTSFTTLPRWSFGASKIAKPQTELHLDAPKLISDLRPGESGYMAFTDFDIQEDGQCFLGVGALLRKEKIPSTIIEVHRDDDGYHVIIPESMEYTLCGSPSFQAEIPVASVTLVSEE